MNMQCVAPQAMRVSPGASKVMCKDGLHLPFCIEHVHVFARHIPICALRSICAQSRCARADDSRCTAVCVYITELLTVWPHMLKTWVDSALSAPLRTQGTHVNVHCSSFTPPSGRLIKRDIPSPWCWRSYPPLTTGPMLALPGVSTCDLPPSRFAGEALGLCGRGAHMSGLT